jgi:hypothetical protein
MSAHGIVSRVTPVHTAVRKELLPAATLFGYLVNPANPGADLYAKEASNAAKALGIVVSSTASAIGSWPLLPDKLSL